MGAAVAGAKITLRHLGTAETRDLASNESGDFSAQFLRVGPYSITVSNQGFKSKTITPITVRVDQTVNLPIDLEIGAAEAVGLIGDNGAGKSTLVKILSGVYEKDSGTVVFDGTPAEMDAKAPAAMKMGSHAKCTVRCIHASPKAKRSPISAQRAGRRIT